MNIETAKAFAHAAHDSIGQRRKYTDEPYWVHTDEVAEILKDFPIQVQLAGHFHDILEDVFPKNPYYSFERIMGDFGFTVAVLTKELTDMFTKEAFPMFNRAERKHLEHNRLGMISPAAKNIKLADVISNTKNIVAYDRNFARVYLMEVVDLMRFLKGGDEALYAKSDAVVVEAIATFKKL